MKTIKTKADLKAEKARLRLQLSASEEQIKDDIQWLKDELMPVKIAGKFLNNAVSDKSHGFVHDGVRFTVDKLLKNVLLARAGWITKLIVPFVVKNISSNFLEEKKADIFGAIKNFIHQTREKNTKDHSHSKADQDGESHYDKSTAHEMGY